MFNPTPKTLIYTRYYAAIQQIDPVAFQLTLYSFASTAAFPVVFGSTLIAECQKLSRRH